MTAYVTTRDAAGLTSVSLAEGQRVLAPFLPPEIRRFEVLRILLLAVRVAMTVWAFTLGAVASRSADDVVSLDRAVRTLIVVGAAIAALWFVLGATWSVLRTRNIQRLDGRYPTQWRAARVWLYAPVWIAVMSVTLVQLEPNPDFDVRPPIIVVGFVLAMLPIYRIVQRLFRSLVRVRPDAATFVLFIVDTIAIGLIWWRIATWPERAVDIGPTTTDLLTSAAFASAIALLVGLLAAVYLDLEVDRAEDTRLLALRSRHDHRIARLQGLDPLESATRWALWTARQAADRAAAEAAAAVRATDVAVSQTGTAPPAPTTIEPVGSTIDPVVVASTPGPITIDERSVAARQRPLRVAGPDATQVPAPVADAEPPVESVSSLGAILPTLPPANRASEPDPEPQPQPQPQPEPEPDGVAAPLSTVERIRRRIVENERGPAVGGDASSPERLVVPPEPEPEPAELAGELDPAADEPEPAAAAAGTGPGDDVEPAPQSADDALARALRRRFAEAEREAQRPRRRPGVIGEPAAAEPISDRGRRLAASIGAELDRGVRSDFAERVRALSEQFGPEQAVPERRREASIPVSQAAPARTVEPSARPIRLIALELARYVTVALFVVGAIASGWMVVAVSRFDALDSEFYIDGLEQARSIAILAFIAASISSLAWLYGAARYAAEVEPAVRVWPFIVLLAGAALAVVGAGVVEGRSVGSWSLGAMIVSAVAVLIALRSVLAAFDTFAVSTWTVSAWLLDTVAIVVFVLASPLGSELDGSANAGRVAFGAVLVGVSLTIGAVLVALTTMEYENALRGSTELARLIESKHARSRDTHGSSQSPSGSPPSG